MNAILVARMVAPRIQGPRDFAHGAVCGADRITVSSQGSWTSAHIFAKSIFAKRVVWIAVQPAFARLRGSDHRMCSRVRVFACVLIRRAVAAERDATCLARAQMYPLCTDLYTFCALTNFRLLDRSNCIEMRAASVGHYSMSLFRVTKTCNSDEKHLFIEKLPRKIPPLTG